MKNEMARLSLFVFALVVLFSFAPSRVDGALIFWQEPPYYLNGTGGDVDVTIECDEGDYRIQFYPDGTGRYNFGTCPFPYFNPLPSEDWGLYGSGDFGSGSYPIVEFKR